MFRISWVGGPPRRATKPVPHASWSGCPQFGWRRKLHMTEYWGQRRTMYNAEFFWNVSGIAGRCDAPNTSKLGDFAEMKIADFHWGNHHFEGFFGGGAAGGAEAFNIL